MKYLYILFFFYSVFNLKNCSKSVTGDIKVITIRPGASVCVCGGGGGLNFKQLYNSCTCFNKSQEIKGSVIHIQSNTKGLTGLGAFDKIN